MPPIRKGDGTGIQSLRLGDGTNIQEVRKGDGSVLWQKSSGLPDSEIDHFNRATMMDRYSSGNTNGNISLDGAAAYEGDNGVVYSNEGTEGAYTLESDGLLPYYPQRGDDIYFYARFPTIGNQQTRIQFFGTGSDPDDDWRMQQMYVVSLEPRNGNIRFFKYNGGYSVLGETAVDWSAVADTWVLCEITTVDDGTGDMTLRVYEGVNTGAAELGAVSVSDTEFTGRGFGLELQSGLDEDRYLDTVSANEPYGELMTDGGTTAFVTNGESNPTYINESMGLYNGTADTTFVVYQGEDLDPYVAAYDHAAAIWGDPVQIGSNPLTDDFHGPPAMAQDDNGIIHAVWGGHRTDYQYARTTSANDITSWTSPTSISGQWTYPHMFENGSELFIVTRDDDSPDGTPQNVLSILRSSDGGDTWTEEQYIINFGSGWSVYPEADGFDADGRLHITWRAYDQSAGEHLNTYHVKWDPADNTFYAADGTDLGTSLDKTTADNNCLVYDSNTDGSEDTHQVLDLDSTGTPHITWAHEINGNRYCYYSMWDGSQWTGPEEVFDLHGWMTPMRFDASDNPVLLGSRRDSNIRVELWKRESGSWSLQSELWNQADYDTPPMSWTANKKIRNANSELRWLWSEVDQDDYSTARRVWAHDENDFVV